MKRPAKSIFYRRLTDTNVGALTGKHRGEYDLRLGRRIDGIREFFELFPDEDTTPLGGWTKEVVFAPYDGPSAVPRRTVRFRYMGEESQRRDYYFASQRLEDAYDLWRPGRALPVNAEYADVQGDIVVIVRDAEDSYHARYIRQEDLTFLPVGLREALESHTTGVYTVTESAPAIEVSTAAQRVFDAMLQHRNILLYGPPATGKTHIVQEVLDLFRYGEIVVDTAEERRPLEATESLTAWATFHQSYSYEDFIVGLRPTPNPSGGFRLEAVPGVFLELTEWARTTGRRSLLIIDEINRGNVSRIFGEFITLMEPDKRLAEDGTRLATTVNVRLPYIRPETAVTVNLPDGTTATVPTPFAMPLPVYTLATMNSVDKSVAPLDAALRRRFHLINLFPDLQAMARQLGVDAPSGGGFVSPTRLDDASDIARLALALLDRLNHGIRLFLGADFQFGQWYLRPLVGVTDVLEARRILANLWRTSLFPQLEEYFTGRNDQLLAVLDVSDAAPSLIVEVPGTSFEELGALTVVTQDESAADGEVEALILQVVRAQVG
jgi:5-methylcytosine-specific restriction enzyme B